MTIPRYLELHPIYLHVYIVDVAANADQESKVCRNRNLSMSGGSWIYAPRRHGLPVASKNRRKSGHLEISEGCRHGSLPVCLSAHRPKARIRASVEIYDNCRWQCRSKTQLNKGNVAWNLVLFNEFRLRCEEIRPTQWVYKRW
jgi:hypothetical protein